MTHVACYPQPGKHKALQICEAFSGGVRAAGGKATVCTTTPDTLLDGDCFFYGARPFNAHLWNQCRAEGRTFFYCDNSYFDVTREKQFRVTKNAIQHTGLGETDGWRFKALGLTIKPPHRNGGIVVAAAQSAEFMATVAGDPDWLPREVEAQRAAGHQVLIRHKGEKRPLAEDLARARLLLTWSSAAAVGALLAGIPVRCAPQCCAHGIAMDDRERWAGVLADQQFSIDEMRSGFAWRQVKAGLVITGR